MRNGQLNNGFSIFIQFFKSSVHPLSTGKLLGKRLEIDSARILKADDCYVVLPIDDAK